MKLLRQSLLVLALGAGSFIPGVARADEAPLVDAKELERADQLFKDANAAYKAKDLPKARELYLEAYKIKRTYDIAGHLGRTEFELGLYRDAAEHLADCLRNAPPNQGKKPFERVIEDLQAAKKEVGTVLLEAPPGAVVFVDGREVGKAPLNKEVFVETGKRRFEARLGDASGVVEKELTKGSSATVTIHIEGKPAPGRNTGGPQPNPDPDPAPVPSPDGRPSWPGWLMGGVGLVAAGVGGALIGVGQGKLGDAEDIGDEIEAAGGNCEPVQGPLSERCAEGTDALGSAGTLTTAGIVLAATGGALLIGGIIYLVVPDGSAASEETALVPLISPDFVGFTFSTSF